MKILVDLIHPANYHYFKYFIQEMKLKNHNVVITARNKDILQKLLILDKVDFISTGRGKIGKGALGKLLYLLFAEFFFFRLFRKMKPDIVLSFASTPCAHNSFIFRIPHISFDDTEHAKLNRKLYAPFTDVIFTPMCFYENIGKKQLRFNGYMELFYLNEIRFKPDENIFSKIGLSKTEKIILVRFVSWEAFHDLGQKGLSLTDKINLVEYLSKKAKVFISSEAELPKELNKYKLEINENNIHDFLSFVTLYIGEGATMASECAMLGIPSIYINSLPLMGYLQEAKKYGLLFNYNNLLQIKDKASEIIEDVDAKFKYKNFRDEFIKNMIDPTSLLVWFIDNYPASKEILLKDPSYQNNFKS